MPYYEQPRPLQTTRTIYGWTASYLDAPGVVGRGATEDAARADLDALFANPPRWTPSEDAEHSPAPWQV